MSKIGIALLLVLSACLGFIAGRQICAPIEPPKPQIDTLYVRDTISVSTPAYLRVTQVDSVLVPVRDTIRERDTLFVWLEREHIEWQDSLSVVYASGIEPRIDSVKHFIERVVVTQTIPYEVKVRNRWGIGVTAGYGFGSSGLSPFVGFGVSYNLYTW